MARGKRKTPADYHALANKRGFKWLGPAVKNVGIKTGWQCSVGHEWETGYRVIAIGSGCPYCVKRIKVPADYRKIAQTRNFKWLGPEVPNMNTKTIWQCSKGHYWLAAYQEINRGRGCPRCAHNARKTPEDYRLLAESRNFKWVGPVVSRSYDKTWWICDNGHRWYTTYSAIRWGYKCPYCCGRRKTRQDYHVLAKERGFQWLGKKLPRVIDRTLWKCKNGHQWEACFDSIRGGNGCPFCAGNARKLPGDYHSLAESRNFQWLGPDVRNNSSKTSWMCEKSHTWETCYAGIASGRGCPTCAREDLSERSKQMWKNGVFDSVFQSPTSIELAVSKALNSLGIEHQSQYRPDGYSRIYDEFIPPNILIEIHGDYWHGSERPEQQKKDVEKTLWAKNNGFIPTVFWEHEIKVRGAEVLIEERILPLLNKE